MLQLFIQIYANQVQAFLKSNADTPILIREQDDELAKYLMNTSKGLSNESRNSVALDVLSYAATLKKELHVVNEFNEKVKKGIQNTNQDTNETSSSSPNMARFNKSTNSVNETGELPKPDDVFTPNDLSNSSRSPASAITNANSFLGIPGFEEIDQSVYNIGEEYWSDIVNPDNNNFNLDGKSGFANDVFFMT